jgi:hypothetical protein
MDKKSIIIMSLILVLIPNVFAEIIVQTSNSGYTNHHNFVVNKYFFTQQQVQQQQVQVKIDQNPEIQIEPINTTATVYACEEVQMNFKLSNPSKNGHIYKFSIADFKGTAYLSQNLVVNPKKTVLINFVLVPDCRSSGIINPRIIVETENERATLPIMIDVIPIDIIEPYECEYYYNSTVCEGQDYLKFYESTNYDLDLSERFFDPDADRLKYSAQALNLDVKFRGEIAQIKSRWDFIGAEELVIKADDGKGGKAFSKIFFVHVIDNNRSKLENFFAYYWPHLLLVLFVFLLIILLVVISSKDDDHHTHEHHSHEHEEHEENHPKKNKRPTNKKRMPKK